ncbi:MAG TPA: pilus assembly PilX N-terminal domain-containing protein [Desulfuromonadales bacterium]|nr:pilus assembly PilX N-terminal domain-containing protein [Desulfuromonadales bacterium]
MFGFQLDPANEKAKQGHAPFVPPFSLPARSLDNQRGTALVLALVMLALMSILGVMSLTTSTTEVGISGNYRSSQQAFYAADRAVEYAMTNEQIFDSIGTGTIDLIADADTTNATATTNDDHITNIAAETGNSGLQSGGANQVTYLTSGALPPGTGSDPTYFQARYYVITVNSQGPNNSAARVETQVARIVPK